MTTSTYRIVGHGLDGAAPSLSLIVLNLTYLDPDREYCASHWCALTAEQPTDTWQFDAPAGSSGVVLYRGQQFSLTGEPTPIPLEVAQGATIDVGADVQPSLAITVTPVLIDWSRVARVDGTIGDQPFSFTAEQADARWFAVPNVSYTWTATYTLTDDSFWTQSGTAFSPLLVLAALPPVETVTFTPVEDDFETLPVATIALTVLNPGGLPRQTLFDPAHTGPWSTRIFQTPTSLVTWQADCRYRYIVSYKPSAGLLPFDSGEIDGKDSTSFTLDEVGIREFVADKMPAVITRITAHYESASEKKTCALTAGGPPTRLVAGQQYTAGSFAYWLEYTLAGASPDSTGREQGSVIVSGPTPAPAAVRARSPLSEKTFTLTAQQLGADDEVQVAIDTTETGNLGIPQRKWTVTSIVSGNHTLTRAHPSISYRYWTVDADAAATHFIGTRIIDDNEVPFDVSSADASVSITPTTMPAAIRIDPSLVDWRENDHVDVTLTFTASSGSDPHHVTFTNASGYGYAGTISVDDIAPIYSYVARYTLRDGTTRIASADHQSGTVLVLPIRGSA